jgi:hypothetical protein
LFYRRNRFNFFLIHPDPEIAEWDSKDHNEQAIEILYHGRWHCPAEDLGVSLIIRNKGQRRTSLFECSPEKHHEKANDV